MEPKSLIPCLQKPASFLCPETDQDRPRPPPLLLLENPILIWSSHLRLGFPSGLSPLSLPTKTLYPPLLFPTCVTCPTHHILLDLITRLIFVEQCGSGNTSICHLFHSPATSSLVGPSFLITPFSRTFRPVFSLHCDRPSFTPTRNNRHTYQLPTCAVWHPIRAKAATTQRWKPEVSQHYSPLYSNLAHSGLANWKERKTRTDKTVDLGRNMCFGISGARDYCFV